LIQLRLSGGKNLPLLSSIKSKAMRNISFLTGVALLMSSFVTDSTIVKNESISDLSCYEIKNKTVSHNDFNIWVVTNEFTLEELFTAGDCAVKPDFQKEIVVALKVETALHNYRVDYKKITTTENSVNVYFHVVKQGAHTDEGSPVSVTSVPKTANTRKINFYHDNTLVKTVPIVAVY
jgi:hypothetical protein